MAWSEIWEQPLATPNLSALTRRLLLARLDLLVPAPTPSFHQSGSAFALPLRCLERSAQPLTSFVEETKSANPGGRDPTRAAPAAQERAPRCCAQSQMLSWTPEVPSLPGLQMLTPRWHSWCTQSTGARSISGTRPFPEQLHAEGIIPGAGTSTGARAGDDAARNRAVEQTPSCWECNWSDQKQQS